MENSNYLNIIKQEIEKLKEQKTLDEIKIKKDKALNSSNDIINLFKQYFDKDFLDINSLKINYFNNINKYIDEANPKFFEAVKSKPNIYFNLIEKKTAKILVVYRHVFKEMNIKNLICNMIYFNLFLEKIKINFNVDISNQIQRYMNENIIENIKSTNIQAIRKIGILLSGDNWKRVALQDDHE